MNGPFRRYTERVWAPLRSRLCVLLYTEGVLGNRWDRKWLQTFALMNLVVIRILLMMLHRRRWARSLVMRLAPSNTILTVCRLRSRVSAGHSRAVAHAATADRGRMRRASVFVEADA